MWDFGTIMSSIGNGLADLGGGLYDYGKDALNKSTGGMVDYFSGKLKPTEQTDNPVQNVLAGSKSPGLGQLTTDLGAGNWGSALGNIGAMGQANAPSAAQMQAAQAQQQQSLRDASQQRMAQDQANWMKQGQQLAQQQEDGKKMMIQLAGMFGI